MYLPKVIWWYVLNVNCMVYNPTLQTWKLQTFIEVLTETFLMDWLTSIRIHKEWCVILDFIRQPLWMFTVMKMFEYTFDKFHSYHRSFSSLRIPRNSYCSTRVTFPFGSWCSSTLTSPKVNLPVSEVVTWKILKEDPVHKILSEPPLFQFSRSSCSSPSLVSYR